MTTPENTLPPSLDELMERFLTRPSAGDPLPQSEVEPQEVITGLRTEPRLAWKESLAVLPLLGAVEASGDGPLPSDWAQLVLSQQSYTSLAFALGNYPQLVRDFASLLRRETLTKAKPTSEASPSLATSAMKDWAQKTLTKGNPEAILAAVGVLRLAREYDLAEKLLNDARTKLPSTLASVIANEEAALLWHRGKCQEAFDSWMKQGDSIPVMFNRGMAALFLGREGASRYLAEVIGKLPDTSAWYHLAQLYLKCAE
jgi:tetratricopeptide (TPR) repeat protein